MGRSFKNGWGPNTSIVTLTTLWNVDNLQENFLNLKGRTLNDSSRTAVQRQLLYKSADDRFKVRVKR